MGASSAAACNTSIIQYDVEIDQPLCCGLGIRRVPSLMCQNTGWPASGYFHGAGLGMWVKRFEPRARGDYIKSHVNLCVSIRLIPMWNVSQMLLTIFC